MRQAVDLNQRDAAEPGRKRKCRSRDVTSKFSQKLRHTAHQKHFFTMGFFHYVCHAAMVLVRLLCQFEKNLLYRL